jgi:hypothetical protein
MTPVPIPCSRNGRGMERPGALLARRTRTVKLCSPGTRARLGALGDFGRVRILRAVKGNLGHSPKGKYRKWKAFAWAHGTSREIDCEATGG